MEVDITKKWTASAGFQITNYGNTDEFINDISFVVNSWSFGLGAKYQVSDRLAVQAAFFQTNYDKYTTQAVMVEDPKVCSRILLQELTSTCYRCKLGLLIRP